MEGLGRAEFTYNPGGFLSEDEFYGLLLIGAVGIGVYLGCKWLKSDGGKSAVDDTYNYEGDLPDLEVSSI